ncbi:MAG: linked oxidase domain protein, partial [Thermomicrobiales bacterium]|nr:linked oxidase domain protein [Thermomicrobiales bacterium]
MTAIFVDQAIEALRAHFRGELVAPGSPGYEETRRVRNGLIDRHPAVIAFRVDPEARTVRVQGGATWGDVDRETQLFGLATPGGNVSSTGVAGLTLHGGWGWMRRKYGYSVDNLVSVDIVTADGRVRTASESEHPDLFWAIRGAGSNFGVVTSFEFRLHELGPLVAFAAPMYAMEDAERVVPAWRDFMDAAPDEVVLRPLRELATPLLDLSATMPYAVLQGAFDALFPKGRLYYWKSLYLDDFDEEAMAATIQYARDRPTPMTLLGLWHLGGGAASRVGAEA